MTGYESLGQVSVLGYARPSNIKLTLLSLSSLKRSGFITFSLRSC